MRSRWVLAVVVALPLLLSGWEAEPPETPLSGQILAQPDPPVLRLAAPLDAAHADPAPPVMRHAKHITHHPVIHTIHKVIHRVVHVRLGVAAFLACVAHHESHGNYRAENPYSTASGKFQFVDRSWRGYSKMAGYPGWSHAASAPPAVQDAVAAYVVGRSWHYPWRGTGCGYGT